MQQNLVDQLRAFMTVVETQSFSEAARQMGRAVSTISYAVSRLEEQCGFPLLVRGAGKPELTSEGRSVFREAQAIIDSARRFDARVRALKRGEESRLSIAVDVLFPVGVLMSAFSAFAKANPHVALKIFTTSLNRSWSELASGKVDFCLAPLRDLPLHVERQPLTTTELILVAAPHHPLARRRTPFPLSELKRHRQVYYAGDAEVDVERRGRIFGTDVWTSSDLWMIRKLMHEGLVWGFATEEWVGSDLGDGRLVKLDCTDLRSDGRWVFGALWHIDRPPGPMGRGLIGALAAEVAGRGGEEGESRAPKTARRPRAPAQETALTVIPGPRSGTRDP